MTAPWQVAATMVDTSAPVNALTIAAAHAATAFVDAAVQPCEIDASSATTAPRQVAAITVDTSAPAPVDASTVAAMHAAITIVDATIQPREMDASATRLHRDRWWRPRLTRRLRRCRRFLPSLPPMQRRLSSTHRFSRARWTRWPLRLHRDRWRRRRLIR